MSDDEYRTVTTKFRGHSHTRQTIFVDRPKTRSLRSWAIIPRNLIHGVDEVKMDTCLDGQEITFRLMAWKAEELGYP